MRRVAIVTGASSGIGRTSALRFARAGINLAICARSGLGLAETEDESRNLGVDVYAQQCDVGNLSELTGFIGGAADALGGLDILVNNASAFSPGNKESDWERSLAVDLMGAVRSVRIAAPIMAEGGSIVNISSIAGIEAGWGPAYSTAKAALIHYTRVMAPLLAAQGIRINCVAPGPVECNRWEHQKANNPDFYRKIIEGSPFGRLGKSEEISDAVLFLASEPAGWITGQCIVVDGGFHM